MNFTMQPVMWLECAIVLAITGAVCVSFLSDPLRVWRWGVVFCGLMFASTLGAWLTYQLGASVWVEPALPWGASSRTTSFLEVNDLNAPLLPLLGIIHFLTALATGRTKMRRFSLFWSLISAAIRLGIFGSADPWCMIVLLTACVVPPYFELRSRGASGRVYTLHMTLFVVLLVAGWYLLGQGEAVSAWASLCLLLAIILRCGVVPAHCWITDWFEHASFGNALLFVTPMVGVYAALRLVLPIAPDWVLNSIGFISLGTAVYAAGMAVVQRDARRLFAFLFLGHASLVLIGMELHSLISLTGALALWISASLSLTGFGLTLRALEARFGRLTLNRYQGLFEHSPVLAGSFLLTGLASIGFPGTLGFVAAELLVDGAIQANVLVGLGVILAAALNGIAVLRAYFILFTGAVHYSTVHLAVGVRERVAVLTLSVLILGGGLYPQPGISSRYHAAELLLGERRKQVHDEPIVSVSVGASDHE